MAGSAAILALGAGIALGWILYLCLRPERPAPRFNPQGIVSVWALPHGGQAICFKDEEGVLRSLPTSMLSAADRQAAKNFLASRNLAGGDSP